MMRAQLSVSRVLLSTLSMLLACCAAVGRTPGGGGPFGVAAHDEILYVPENGRAIHAFAPSSRIDRVVLTIPSDKVVPMSRGALAILERGELIVDLEPTVNSAMGLIGVRKRALYRVQVGTGRILHLRGGDAAFVPKQGGPVFVNDVTPSGTIGLYLVTDPKHPEVSILIADSAFTGPSRVVQVGPERAVFWDPQIGRLVEVDTSTGVTRATNVLAPCSPLFWRPKQSEIGCADPSSGAVVVARTYATGAARPLPVPMGLQCVVAYDQQQDTAYAVAVGSFAPGPRETYNFVRIDLVSGRTQVLQQDTAIGCHRVALDRRSDAAR
jgi:hypothetical protein